MSPFTRRRTFFSPSVGRTWSRSTSRYDCTVRGFKSGARMASQGAPYPSTVTLGSTSGRVRCCDSLMASASTASASFFVVQNFMRRKPSASRQSATYTSSPFFLRLRTQAITSPPFSPSRRPRPRQDAQQLRHGLGDADLAPFPTRHGVPVDAEFLGELHLRQAEPLADPAEFVAGHGGVNYTGWWVVPQASERARR